MTVWQPPDQIFTKLLYLFKHKFERKLIIYEMKKYMKTNKKCKKLTKKLIKVYIQRPYF
jgi:hypothetical protein